jgi:hypothetical protein
MPLTKTREVEVVISAVIRDESGNGKIPYRLTPNPALADRVPFLQEKQEKKTGNQRVQEQEQGRLFPDRIHGSRI